MGYVKRVIGLLQAKDYVPREAQIIVGLVRERDPEAYLERKRAEREARLERLAIREESIREGKAASGSCQQESSKLPVGKAVPSSLATGNFPAGNCAKDLADEAPAWGDERPVPAQPGWYRLGRSFYRSGSGPFPDFGAAATRRPADRPAATKQLTLF